MTDGIGRIFGNSYGVGGFYTKPQEEAPQNKPAEVPVNNYEETQVDPNKVMDFLNANNIFVTSKATTPAELDLATQERIGGYMARFEEIYDLIQKEFGEALAPDIMDLAMDKFIA